MGQSGGAIPASQAMAPFGAAESVTGMPKPLRDLAPARQRRARGKEDWTSPRR